MRSEMRSKNWVQERNRGVDHPPLPPVVPQPTKWSTFTVTVKKVVGTEEVPYVDLNLWTVCCEATDLHAATMKRVVAETQLTVHPQRAGFGCSPSSAD